MSVQAKNDDNSVSQDLEVMKCQINTAICLGIISIILVISIITFPLIMSIKLHKLLPTLADYSYVTKSVNDICQYSENINMQTLTSYNITIVYLHFNLNAAHVNCSTVDISAFPISLPIISSFHKCNYDNQTVTSIITLNTTEDYMLYYPGIDGVICPAYTGYIYVGYPIGYNDTPILNVTGNSIFVTIQMGHMIDAMENNNIMTKIYLCPYTIGSRNNDTCAIIDVDYIWNPYDSDMVLATATYTIPESANKLIITIFAVLTTYVNQGEDAVGVHQTRNVTIVY